MDILNLLFFHHFHEWEGDPWNAEEMRVLLGLAFDRRNAEKKLNKTFVQGQDNLSSFDSFLN